MSNHYIFYGMFVIIYVCMYDFFLIFIRLWVLSLLVRHSSFCCVTGICKFIWVLVASYFVCELAFVLETIHLIFQTILDLENRVGKCLFHLRALYLTYPACCNIAYVI
jgi:hypothetical protein